MLNMIKPGIFFVCLAFLICGWLSAAEEMTAEEVYAQRWTREDFEETTAQTDLWINSGIGRGGYAPPPWTPMEARGQEVHCWGRVYRYRNSVMPAQIVSAGEELLAGRPVFVMEAGGRRLVFDRASVRLDKRHGGLVDVRTVSTAGPYTLTLDKGYEFDGMGKIELKLEGRRGAPPVESLHLEVPLNSDRSVLYHYSGGRPGIVHRGEHLHPFRAPMSDAGLMPAGGKTLDIFREVVWLGDRERGLTWFADSMEGWEIIGEAGIQVLGAESGGKRVFRVKLADRMFNPAEEPMELVFGIQATPMRPRPDNFRRIDKMDPRWGDERTINYRWSWSEGHYYPNQSDYAGEAREYIREAREKGMEHMQAGSIEYYGASKFYRNLFGVLSNPGMFLREMLLWRDYWHSSTGEIAWAEHEDDDDAYSPGRALGIKERALARRAAGGTGGRSIEEALDMRHTPPGDWFGQKYRPNPYPPNMCINSSFQDYLVWQIKNFIEQTGVGAYYLDNGFRACHSAEHGCGYIDYSGEWAAESPVFAMREAVKRIYFTFYEMNGFPPLIKWHQSSQMALPAMSFIDIHWTGELYTGGVAAPHRDLQGGVFYSEILDEGVMQVFHMGRPFGFLSSLLPNLTRDYYPRTLASEKDMAGLMLIHDSHIEGAFDFSNYPDFVHDVYRRRLSYPLDEMQVEYYWDDEGGVLVSPDNVRHIMHYDREHALLVLFNWSWEHALPAEVLFDFGALGVDPGSLAARDVMTGARVECSSDGLSADILPRDFRMLEIRWGN